MPKLSDAPGTSSVIWAEKHIPFTVYLKADPEGTKRQEKKYDFEKYSDYLERVLETICNNSEGEFSFDFTRPVAWTVQFAQRTARFSINGHACRRPSFTKTPVGERKVIDDNQYKDGPGAANASNEVPDADVNLLARELKAIFESITGFPVIGLRVANVKFGFRNGTHFP